MDRKQLAVEYRVTSTLRPYEKNARKHSKKQVRQIADSIERFGFTNPILVTEDGSIIAGHGRVSAAKLLGLETVPTIRVEHLSEAERRAYILADNKLALNSTWDAELLGLELQSLIELDLSPTSLGFSLAEIDLALDAVKEADPAPSSSAREDEIPELQEVAVSGRGDLWQLGRHCLLCGDAREPADYSALLFDEPVDMVFTDPPYNCPINGHVSGLGRVKHREFAMASGEMSEQKCASRIGTMSGHGGARSGAGRPPKWSFGDILTIGQACEVRWGEACQEALEARLASLPHASEIQRLWDGVRAIPESRRRSWLNSESYRDHSGDIEALLHARARTPFNEETADYEGEAPRTISVSTKPVRGTRQRIVGEVATEFQISESAVENLWQAYRRVEREGQDSAET